MKITCWYRYNKKTKDKPEHFSYNHFSKDWNDCETAPSSNCAEQTRTWKKQFWQKRYAYLVDGVVELVKDNI